MYARVEVFWNSMLWLQSKMAKLNFNPTSCCSAKRSIADKGMDDVTLKLYKGGQKAC